MAIRRFTAIADATITNTYLAGLETRASGANMGLADSLEAFSVYGQKSSSFGSGHSSELSRVLVKFPVVTGDDSTNSIQAKRNSGAIPASGSVSFYLKMYNVAHADTLPLGAKMNVFAVSSSWEEGRGLDLDTYTDITYDNVGSNWNNANGSGATGSADFVITSYSNLTAGDAIKFRATDGTIITATADGSTTTETDTNSPTFQKETDAATTAANLETCLNANSHLSASVDSATVTVHQTENGIAGNTKPVVTSGGSVGMTAAKFNGGNGPWANVGGDYHTGSVAADLNSAIMYSQTFPSGSEDLEVDVTHLVERWIRAPDASNEDAGYSNYGIGIFLTSSYEAYFSSSTGEDLPRIPPHHDNDSMSALSGGVPHNLEGATTSYYTKKFSARSSEYFFRRPVIEARWDSSTKDDRGSFYYSSSIANPSENLNTIYFYNYFRGQLRDIPLTSGHTDNNLIYVSFFSGNLDNTEPTGTALLLVDDKTHVNSTNVQAVTGGYVSTGIYSASVCLTSAALPLSGVFDVWFKGVARDHVSSSTAVHYYTGSIKPVGKLNASSIAPYTQYVSNITNLRNSYRNYETARFRVHSRKKDWVPTIYSKATAEVSVNTPESGAYEIYRVIDELKIIPYGTGSDMHTRMSFDESGSYFDLDMEMLETSYMYGIRLSYYNNSVGSWVEQPETFKFRVED